MKVIIAGSRDIVDSVMVRNEIENYHYRINKISEVVCGMASGVDTLGRYWAEDWNIPVKEFPADWEKYGNAAGPKRNKQMAEYADAALVIYSPGASKGSTNMVATMKKMGKPVHEVKV